MRAGVPIVHRLQRRRGLRHSNHRALRQHLQVGVGNNCRNLDDVMLLGDEPGHLHIDPYQILITDHRRALLLNRYMTSWVCGLSRVVCHTLAR